MFKIFTDYIINGASFPNKSTEISYTWVMPQNTVGTKLESDLSSIFRILITVGSGGFFFTNQILYI